MFFGDFYCLTWFFQMLFLTNNANLVSFWLGKVKVRADSIYVNSLLTEKCAWNWLENNIIPMELSCGTGKEKGGFSAILRRFTFARIRFLEKKFAVCFILTTLWTLHGSSYSMSVDLRCSYWGIPMSEEDKKNIRPLLCRMVYLSSMACLSAFRGLELLFCAISYE